MGKSIFEKPPEQITGSKVCTGSEEDCKTCLWNDEEKRTIFTPSGCQAPLRS
jgi:hypothetical protein